MAGKKNKTKISKRRQKAKQQKAKKRKLRLVKGGAALFGGSRGLPFHFIFAGHHGIRCAPRGSGRK